MSVIEALRAAREELIALRAGNASDALATVDAALRELEAQEPCGWLVWRKGDVIEMTRDEYWMKVCATWQGVTIQPLYAAPRDEAKDAERIEELETLLSVAYHYAGDIRKRIDAARGGKHE